MGVISDDWCGWRILPPGFQFPVKELVASNLEKRNSPLIKGLLHAILGRDKEWFSRGRIFLFILPFIIYFLWYNI
jgi:hypothetical protein